MKRMNRRTGAVCLAAVLAAVLCTVYACGILIPEEAVTGSFLNAWSIPLARTLWEGICSCAH